MSDLSNWHFGNPVWPYRSDPLQTPRRCSTSPDVRREKKEDEPMEQDCTKALRAQVSTYRLKIHQGVHSNCILCIIHVIQYTP